MRILCGWLDKYPLTQSGSLIACSDSKQQTQHKSTMKQNTSFDITASEVLEALTDAINKEFRYTGYKPNGEALSVTPLPEGGLRVEWGEKPEASDDVPYAAPALSVTPTPTPAALEA